MLDVSNTFTARIHIKKKLYAKAIYDNTADSPDELSFKKGDILTVFEQNTDDLEGWWLCSFRGQQGICPGNRLRILNSYDSGCFSPSPPSSPCPSLGDSTATLNSSICSGDVYENASIISATESLSGDSITCTSNTQLYYTPLHQSYHNHNTHFYQAMHRNSHNTRRSWHVSTNKGYGDVYVQNLSKANQSQSLSPGQRNGLHQLMPHSERIYQNVSSMMSNSANNDFETYDIPKPATPVNYDCPKNVFPIPPPINSASMKGSASSPIQEESYDVPRPLPSTHSQRQFTLMSSCSNSSLHPNETPNSSLINRSNLTNKGDYDIPRRNPIPVRLLQNQHLNDQPQTVETNCKLYDFPLLSKQLNTEEDMPYSRFPKAKNVSTSIHVISNSNKELPLELSSALETLAKLQSEATLAITRLLSFVSPNWRLREKLEPVLMEVKLAALRLRSVLHDLTEFGDGSLGNASRSEDSTLAPKLRPLIRALRDADKLIHKSSQTLEEQGGWTLDNLVRSDDKTAHKPPDSLDQLIACAQTLTEDVRQTASFIQGNALLLFKRTQTTVVPDNDAFADAVIAKSESYDHTYNVKSIRTPNSDWLEDYDYVSFESKDAAAMKNSVLREAIPLDQKKNFDTVIKVSETTVMATASSAVLPSSVVVKPNCRELTDKDKLVLRYYSKQISNHIGNLQQAIDSFLETVEKNQPPKFFIAYGKFVVVSAHNLVTIGDIVHRNVSKTQLREKILCCTDALSDALKACVTKSRKAAAHFPSVLAVQEMVDSVMNISNLAFDLKNAMLHAVQLSL